MIASRVRLPCSTLLLAMMLPGTARAQRLTIPYAATETSPIPSAPRPQTDDRIGEMVGGGILGGAVGFATGAMIGMTLERSQGCWGDEWCGLGGAFLGGVIGETAGLALGVHLANDGRGEYLAALGGSLGGMVAGWAIGGVFHRGEVLLIVPIGQIIAASAFERRSMRPPPPPR